MDYRILHIEDDPLMRAAIKDYFKIRLGIPHILEQQDNAEHLLTVGKNEYHLIISDNDTKSKIFGMDALVEARRNGLETPIIIHTSLNEDPTKLRQEIERRGGIYAPKSPIGHLITETHRILTMTTSTGTAQDYNTTNVPPR